MSAQTPNDWVTLFPPFPEGGRARRIFREFAARLAELSGTDKPQDIDEALDSTLTTIASVEHGAAVRAELCVLTDLARQRWSIRVTEAGDVEVRRPDEHRRDPKREKARIRLRSLSSVTSNFERRRLGPLSSRWRRNRSTAAEMFLFIR